MQSSQRISFNYMCNTTFCLLLNWSRLRCFCLLDDNLAISNLYIPEGGSMGINGNKKISAAFFLNLLLDGISFLVVWEKRNGEQ